MYEYGNTVLEVTFGERKKPTSLLAKKTFAAGKWKQSKPGNLPNPAVPWVNFSDNRIQQEFTCVSTEVNVYTVCAELNENIR